MNITDTHCHLNDPSFEKRLSDVIGRAAKAGVSDFIVPAYNEDSLGITRELAKRYKNIHPAYGIHPWYIRTDFGISSLKEFLEDSRTVAVGEIGLDYAEDVSTSRDIQKRVLVEQIELALSFDLPVLLHCRRAHQDMLEILRNYAGRIRGIMHSYSGSREMIADFINTGMYFSFSGAVTRSHAKKYHRNAVAVPLDRILFETDAPSISTQSVNAADVEPCHITEIIGFVAQLRKTDRDTLVKASIENVKSLFGDRLGE